MRDFGSGKAPSCGSLFLVPRIGAVVGGGVEPRGPIRRTPEISLTTPAIPKDPIYRGNISPRGATSAISAINFLMSKLPKDLKSFATKTKAPGPPITLSR
jgi:hypothetical protein